MTYTAPPLCPTFAPDVPSDRLLTRNLAALSACDLDLARRVAAAHTQVRGPDSRERPVQVRASVSGWPTIAVGEWRLHSAHDPLAEAHGQAQRVPVDAPPTRYSMVPRSSSRTRGSRRRGRPTARTAWPCAAAYTPTFLCSS